MGYQINNQIKGNKYVLFVAFVVFAFLTITVFPSILYAEKNTNSFGSVSLGVVDVTYLMEHAPQAEIASNLLKSKFQPQEKALAKVLDEIQVLEAALEKGAETLTVTERRQKERELRSKKRSRSRALQDFREELRFARDSALDDVQKEVFQAIDAVRQRLGIDIVLQDYVSASKRIDITELVLAHLKQKLVKAKEFNQLEK
jgi:outer membrane protein